MGTLLCKQKINDETIDIIQEVTDTDHDGSQLLTAEKKNRLDSENGTKISRTSSIKVVMGRKIAALDDKDVVNNRNDAPLLDADEDINDQQSNIDDNLEETLTEDKDHSVKGQIQTDVEKTTSENSSGYQSHAELTSLESLLPNEVSIPDEITETTSTRKRIRRHQSLPSNIPARQNGFATRGGINLPGTLNKRKDVSAEEKNNQFQIINVDEYEHSTSNPNNRPKAARGIRSSLNSFNLGLRRRGQKISDTLRQKKPKEFLAKDTESDQDTTKSSSAECDFSDIKIYIKRLESETKRISYSDTIFKYKASIAVNETMPSNENSSGKHKAVQRGRIVFKDCKVKLNFSERSNICEVSLPRCILDMKQAECEESDADETSCV